MVITPRCSRCEKQYASVGYKDNKAVCLFCLQLDVDIKNLGQPPKLQGIKENHIIVNNKTSDFWHCRYIETRSNIHGIRNYYYCRNYQGYMDTVWFKEEDIRPVNEEEADAATSWIMASSINEHLKPTFTEHTNEEPDFILEEAPKCIDLFAGAGGFTLGMAHAGYNVVGHVEFDKYALETYECNKERCGFPNSELIGHDITDITDDEILAFKSKHGHIHLICGGPPCQGFSLVGKRDPKDPRNSLFTHFVRFVKLIKPTCFIMENVPGMKSQKTAAGESVMKIILQSLREIGYNVDWRILNAANYYVPQHRRRIIIIGNNKGKEPDFPLPITWGNDEGNKKLKEK